ncbi:MAG: hypothetical protein JSU59_04955 [Nitrospirota bacterium]|nr:MAG: hypothetical protein JSU59_04955 [Nitrospirota bacterium]
MDKDSQIIPKRELDDDDRTHIIEVFDDNVVPKLRKLQARNGTLSCEFAGAEYRNWLIQFVSAGPDFEIVEFEYDEEARGFSLDF